jgi:hypothetical protein
MSSQLLRHKTTAAWNKSLTASKISCKSFLTYIRSLPSKDQVIQMMLEGIYRESYLEEVCSQFLFLFGGWSSGAEP